MGEKTELKAEPEPCPFCGARPEKSEFFSSRSRIIYVHPAPQGEDDACIANDIRLGSDRPERIAAWNTRAQPTPQDQGSLPDGWRDGEALPIELAGPWHPDETGTFNSAGWGFTVLVPDRFWDRPDNELPPEVTAIAEALERSVRKHLNTASPGEKPGPDSQTSGGG